MAHQREERITFFSDIRGFSEATARRGDLSAYELVRTHNEIAQKRLDAHGGRLVKTYGDGVMAVFPPEAPEEALRCAAAIQQDLHRLNQERDDLQIFVGIGLHVGEVLRVPTERDEDYIGNTVNVTKRLAEQAKGGQILISQKLYERARGAEDVGFLYGGTAPLKGVGEVALYEVIWWPERARLRTRDDALLLVLTEDEKLLIRLSREALQQELERMRGTRLGKWLFRRLLPRMLDWAGFGREHPVRDVRLAWDGERLRVYLKRRWGHLDIDFDAKDLNAEEAQAFVAAFQALRGQGEGGPQRSPREKSHRRVELTLAKFSLGKRSHKPPKPKKS